jgi:hypothetical protein
MKLFLIFLSVFAVVFTAGYVNPFNSSSIYSEGMLQPYLDKIAYYQGAIELFSLELSDISFHDCEPFVSRIAFLKKEIFTLQQLIVEEESSISMLQPMILYYDLRTN